MTSRSGPPALVRLIRRSDQRSPLFWWMVDHHDEFAASAALTRVPWVRFCADAASEGLTDTRGRPVTIGNAKETWRQARKHVARLRQLGAGAVVPLRPGAVPPSRISADWRPQLAGGSVLSAETQADRRVGSSLPVPVASTALVVSGPGPDASLDLGPFKTVEEQEAHVREQRERLRAFEEKFDAKYDHW